MDNMELLKLYEEMYLLRRFDEKCMDLKMEDLIMDGFHPYWGEEACAVGVSNSLREGDYVLSTHRPQGHALGKGSDPKKLFAEMLGRVGGVSEGIGGPMQFIDTDNNFYCGSIVGSGLAIATGVAMVLKERGEGDIVAAYYGDGASSTGACHESMNLASIWKLPILFVLENNQYGEAMPVKEFVSCYPISKRAAGYSFPGITIDGNDIEVVADTAAESIKKIRMGEGPILLELMTYRVRGHYGGDPDHLYRSSEEVNEHILLCPIKRLREKLIGKGVAEADIDRIESEVNESLDAAEKWALGQRFPTLEEATSNVLFGM